MAKEIVGKRSYSFEGKDGNEVVGCNLYLQWEDDEVEGFATESVSVSDKKLDGYVPEVGDHVRVGYNKYGKCDFVIPCAE